MSRPSMPPELNSQDILLQSLETPVVVLDAFGKILWGNTEGKRHIKTLKDKIEALHLRTYKKTAFLFDDFLQPLCSTSLEVGHERVRFSPLSKNETLVEWLPLTWHEELQVLREVGEAVNSSLILEDMFEALGDVLHRYIPYREATIVILDDSQNGIKILVRMQEDGTLEISGENNAFAGNDALIHRLLNDPQPAFYHPNELPDSAAFLPETASALVIPLISKGLVIGLVAMASGTENLFQPYHQTLLSEIVEPVAVAVENAKLYWQTQAQAGREFLINQLTRAIRQSLDINAILSTAVQELGKVMGISRCYIHYFPDKPAEDAPQVFEYVLPGINLISDDQLFALSFEKKVFSQRQKALQGKEKSDISEDDWQRVYNPFVLNDIRDCPSFLEAESFLSIHSVRSLAVFPILIREKMVGTITLHQCDAFRVWVMEDIELLKAIAEHLGVALHQAKLFLELEQQKTTLEKTLQELQQAQVHLIQSEKMAMLGQFVAGIAHEVNTPLGAMASNNETLQSCVKKLNEAEAKGEQADPKWLKTMESLLDINRLASSRIKDIVQNLRNFARLDESELKSVDLAENIDSTLLLLKNALLTQGITVEKRIPEETPRIECFPGLLNQVFMNMLVNAMHAQEGVDKGSIVIESVFNPEEKQLRVSITDKGKGIPESDLARIFDPGFTTKGVGVGTGLGLALCFKIVEKHHGRIEVKSTVGQGTTMSVIIPVSQRKTLSADPLK